ncbi:MAG: RNB domain-containing ribonuclease [Candidatus Brocadiae bacterium]|nr:RNB domain-containing ribonuclease [Candidatus Brocadiia bacterium]
MKNYRLIGLERRGNLLFGLVLKQEKEKQEVYLETGEKVHVPIAKTIHSFVSTVPADTEKSMKLALKTAKENFSTEKVDLGMLWECLETEQEYSFSDMMDLYFSEKNDSHAGAFFLALMENPHYFEYRNGYFSKKSSKRVDENLRREQTEQERRYQEQCFISWLQDNENNDFDPESEIGQRFLNALKSYALEGEEKASAEAKRIAAFFSLGPDEIILLLEQKGILPKDVNETIFRFSLPCQFPGTVVNESQNILDQPVDYANRFMVDHPWNVAIDDEETLEVDDAISYKYENGLHVVGVHIADPSFTIPKNSELDIFACDRFATLYFPDEKMFLFPFSIIQDRMTLMVGQPRPTISAFFSFDENYTLVDSSFKATIFTLNQRKTYQNTKEEFGQEPEYQKLYDIAKTLREKRKAKGAVIMDQPEMKLKISEGQVELRVLPLTSGHLSVSEWMILFNSTLANFFSEKGIPAFYRVQAAPEEPLETNREDPLYPLKTRWALGSASLSFQPGPHYSLGLDAYVQGTSPIRRYTDLVMHRQLISYLKGQELAYTEKDLLQIKVLSERMEKAIKSAEYSRYMFWLLKYLKQNKGKVFQGYVSRFLENSRIMIFIPELMQEFPFKAYSNSILQGDPVWLRIQGASPRKKRAHFEKVFSPTEASSEIDSEDTTE